MRAISIIVPTLNESNNVPVLLARIAETFQGSGVRYEVLFVDDHSTDGTIDAIKAAAQIHPVSLHPKIGERGKAYSLLQGFELARYDVICMIDADLQYPPEAILPMYNLLESSKSDIILTERCGDEDTSKLRQLSSKVFNLAFTQLLFGFHYDSQSGLKLFRKQVIDTITLSPTPWSFDLEFIVRALENNYKIRSFSIPFSKRLSGEAKVKLLQVTYELARASLKLRFTSSPRKIRQAYRMNLQLAKHVGTAMAILILSVAAAGVIEPRGSQPLAALSVGVPGTDTSSANTAQIVSIPLPGGQPMIPAVPATQMQAAPSSSALAAPGGSMLQQPAQPNSDQSGAMQILTAGNNQPQAAANQAASASPTYNRIASPAYVYPYTGQQLSATAVPIMGALVTAVAVLGIAYALLFPRMTPAVAMPLKEVKR